MRCVERYGLSLTGGSDAVAAYNRGVGNLLRLEAGSLYAVAASVALDPTFALGHAAMALLLSVAVPTIAFAGVTTVPQDAWNIVERCAPAYGDDWWFTGLLAFMRQEQGRFDEAMSLACLSLDVEPGAGHSAHARAHAH